METSLTCRRSAIMWDEHLIEWSAMSDDLRELCRGYVTVRNVGGGRYEPTSTSGSAECHANGVIHGVLYRWSPDSVLARRCPGTRGILMPVLEEGRYVTLGDHVTLQWPEGSLFTMPTRIAEEIGA